MNDSDRIISITSLNIADALPATPAGLLEIADVFERSGYHRLSAYLRSCADQMALRISPPSVQQPGGH